MQLPTWSSKPDCGYKIIAEVDGIPDFATYEDGVLKVKTDDEKLVGGY